MNKGQRIIWPREKPTGTTMKCVFAWIDIYLIESWVADDKKAPISAIVVPMRWFSKVSPAVWSAKGFYTIKIPINAIKQATQS